jgi:hypothetical protein
MGERERLGRRAAFSHREYVYRTRDCFEIDEVEGYEVTRKRVFFDDVLLVTHHSFVPWGQVVGVSLLALLLGLSSFGIGSVSRAWGFAFLVLGAVPLAVYAVLLLSTGADAVTIQGKRTQARMHFGLRKKRSLEVFRLAGRLARERQQRLARELLARERAAAPASSEGAPVAASPEPPVVPPVVPAAPRSAVGEGEAREAAQPSTVPPSQRPNPSPSPGGRGDIH